MEGDVRKTKKFVSYNNENCKQWAKKTRIVYSTFFSGKSEKTKADDIFVEEEERVKMF